MDFLNITDITPASKDTEDNPKYRMAKKGDDIFVKHHVNPCCCMRGEVVNVIDVKEDGSMTVKCPVWGEHGMSYHHNSNFRFMGEEDAHEFQSTHDKDREDK